MARAIIAQEIYAEVKDETGLLGRITLALKDRDVYIIHLSAYSVGGVGYLQLITKNNKKAKEIIAHFLPNTQEREVLIVEFENKVGTLAEVARLLGSNDIRIRYVYGTSGDGFKIVGVFSTEDNSRAAKVINEDSGALGFN